MHPCSRYCFKSIIFKGRKKTYLHIYLHICEIFTTFAHRLDFAYEKVQYHLISFKNFINMKKIFFLTMMALCCMQVMAMQLVIEPHSGTDMQLDIARIGKWVFVHNELQLLDKAGNLLASEQINNIRKITFSDLTSDAENVPSENAIIVYPNPTQDVLIIQGVQAQVLRVYDMQGKLVITERGTQVHVADLSNGIYLLQIGTQVVRFIKKD